MNQIVVQGIGFLALLFVILSFQANKRITILLLMLVGLALYSVHYGLLRAWTGSLLNFLEAAMVFVGYKKETNSWAKQKLVPYTFILSFIVVGVITYKSLVDLFPVIAQSFATVAVWQKKPKAIRFFMLIPRPLWFIYNFTVGSYAGMVSEVFIFLSVVTGIFRYDIRSQSK